MERRYPFVAISIDVAARLLQPLGTLPYPRSVQLLTGGHINTNYVVLLEDGQRLVLRIFSQGEEALRKEAKVLHTMASAVPIPKLHLAVFKPASFEHPYAVLDWIEGASLPEVLVSNPEAAVPIGEAVASILSKIHNQRPFEHAGASFLETIRSRLFDQGAAAWLGRETTARLWALAQEQQTVLQELCERCVLVHGDFQGDNILLRLDAGQWKVAAVLDWEWAHGGCYLEDIGSLLRFEGGVWNAFQRGLDSGFSAIGSPLPQGWRRAARLWDMAALCEKLASPLHRGQVTIRASRTIERCLQDFASS